MLRLPCINDRNKHSGSVLFNPLWNHLLAAFFILLLAAQATCCMAQQTIEMQPTVEFLQGTFIYSGKLGSYQVKERGQKPVSVPYTDHSQADLLHFSANDSTVGVTVLSIRVPDQLRFFGGGEQFSHVELTGEHIPFLVEENGIGRGDQPATRMAKLVGAAGHEWATYCPIPLIISTDGRAFLIENDCYAEIDLSRKGQIRFIVHDDQIRVRLFEAGSPKALLKKVSAHLGRMITLPDWSYGTILGIQGGSERAKELVQEAKRYGNPVSAIWIQDWVGKKQTSIGSRLRWEWKPDEQAYPRFHQFCADMNAQNIHVLGYINPFLLEHTAMSDEALEKGLVVHQQNGEPYLIPFGGFKGYIIDLSNPRARTWIKNIIKENLIGSGLSGWMADFAEWLPFDCRLASGMDPKAYHNRFAAEWAKVNREAIQEAGKEGQVVFFSRSGFTGSSAFSTLFWAGDQLVDFGPNDGLGSAITAMISSGLSGLAINHSDIGGYTAIKLPFFKKYLRDKEVLFRWIEFEAFTPIFRTHEGLLPEDMVQVYTDSSTQRFFARFAQIHKALEPYLRETIAEAASAGIPVIRHPWLVFPDDTNCLNTAYQFFVGDDLLVFPVTDRGQQSVRGYFPKGEWKHHFTEETITGGAWRTVDAPLGTPAVFWRVH